MEIVGKLIAKLPVQSGVSKAGNNWTKTEFVVETMEQYPKRLCFSLMNDRVPMIDQFQVESMVQVSFDIESHEFNGKWYTSLRAWRVDVPQPGQMVPGAPAQQGYSQPQYMPQQPMYQQPQGYTQPQYAPQQPAGYQQPVAYPQQQGYAQPQQPQQGNFMPQQPNPNNGMDEPDTFVDNDLPF